MIPKILGNKSAYDREANDYTVYIIQNTGYDWLSIALAKIFVFSNTITLHFAAVR